GLEKVSSRASNGDAVKAQCRLTDADGNPLAVLAAGPDAGIKLEIVADHTHPMEVGRTIADEHGALHRLDELAVCNLVSLGHLEHVFTGSDVYLAAAEAHGENAVLDRRDDLAGVAIAGEHISVGHARHRHVGIALTAAVAGRLHSHESRVLSVLHVSDESAVLD